MFIITALLLGLLVALNPCQLAINISALTYLSNHTGSPSELMRKGVLYTVGRTITYIILGITLTICIRLGLNIDELQQILSKGESILPYMLIAVGIYLAYRAVHHHDHHGDDCHNCGKTIRQSGPFGPLALGLMLAFAFCPESAIIFFGMMLPLSVVNNFGLLAPIAFAITAAIPVVIMVILMAKASEQAQRFASTFRLFQRGANILFALAFFISAIILLME